MMHIGVNGSLLRIKIAVYEERETINNVKSCRLYF